MQMLPSTLIFFTDGIPTYNRLNSTERELAAGGTPRRLRACSRKRQSPTTSSPGTAPTAIARQFEVDLERLIGVYVGTDVNGHVARGSSRVLATTSRTSSAAITSSTSVATTCRTRSTGTTSRGSTPAAVITYQYAASGLTYQYAAAASRGRSPPPV